MITLIPENITLAREYYLDQRTLQPFLTKEGGIMDDTPAEMVQLYTELMEEIAAYDENEIY